ncbi:MAG: sulfite exporter TauE/SafE family protein [Ornithinimicrobium sp.]|uniref:sulfite exporter TauE/SafE family protein n=1 Tax=Ornithinimicrobium sp. TaxID=1977084 RepID=UPI0026DF8638|nr:sulfite exporter TauE/SafE family protein [Ornithinimicrobium sp.]MDO5739422.1 sulfite exporter TauE/SafE family protein [Ornithinimicrobium sp.]
MDIFIEVGIGLLVGLVMGALGGGGAIITVPALVYLLDQPPAVATTTSLVVVGITGVVSVVQHAMHGRIRWSDGLAFGLMGAGGAVLGARVSTDADPRLVMGLFAVLLLLVAAVMWRRAGPNARTDPREMGSPWITWRPFSVSPRRALLVLVVASGVGVLTGFFGVGGGFAIVPALILVLRMPMALAVGTSLLVITINCATGLLGRIGTDLHIDVGLVTVFVIMAVTGSLIGGWIGPRLDPSLLQRVFAGLLLLIAVYAGVNTALG